VALTFSWPEGLVGTLTEVLSDSKIVLNLDKNELNIILLIIFYLWTRKNLSRQKNVAMTRLNIGTF